jgi:hypothetical protein
MFNVSNDGITYINGSNGIYDNKISNKNVKYARNAANNYLSAYSVENMQSVPTPPNKPVFKINSKKSTNVIDKYLSKLDKYIEKLDKVESRIPTGKFNLKYAELNGEKYNPISAVAMAFEELGKSLTIKVSDLSEMISKTFSKDLKNLVSADALDLNKDGVVDAGEYAASIIVEDMISSNPSGKLNASDVNGEINQEGQNQLLAFANKNNYETAHNIFKQVYNDFALDKSLNEFKSDPNNLVK